MCKCLGRVFLLILVGSLLMGSYAFGAPKRLKKPSERKFEIQPCRCIVVPRIHFGYLLYDNTPEYHEATASSEANRMLLGTAVSGEYYVSGRLAAQATVERAWKELSGEVVIGWSIGTGVQYLVTPAGKRSAFCRVEVGRIWIDESDAEAKDYTYYRFGVGLFEYTTPSTTLRIEPFYRRILSEGLNHFYIDEDIDYLGVDLAVGFGL